MAELAGPRDPAQRSLGAARWAAEERPVSIPASQLIGKLTREKHGDQMRRLRATYLDMVASLTNTRIRASLLAMDLAELRLDSQIRQAAIPMSAGALIAGTARPALSLNRSRRTQ